MISTKVVIPSLILIAFFSFQPGLGYAASAVATETPTQMPTLPIPTATPYYDESPVNVPSAEWHPAPITVNHNRFEISVLCRGAFTDSLLAIQPESEGIFFTEFDYRERYYPSRLFQISNRADDLYAPDLTNISTMPVINQHVFYAADMDVDFEGRMVFASRGGYPSDYLLYRKSDSSYDTIPIGGEYSHRSVYVMRQSYPNWDIQTGDLVVLQVLFSGLSRIHRLRLDESDTYRSTIIFETNQEKLLDMTLTPDGELYALSVQPYRIHKLDRSGSIETITKQEFGPENDPLQGRIEYLAAEKAFYILPGKFNDIIRVSEDGQAIGNFTNGQSFVYLKASPDGKTLYVINQTQWQGGSIQALRYIEDNESALAAGDFNNDGQTDASDASALLDAYLHNQTLSDTAMQYMDSNRDGRITPQDAQDLWRRILGG